MINPKDAANQFHFNLLRDEDVHKWAKKLVLNKVGIQIWAKGQEDSPQEFFAYKFEPAKKILWLSFKTSVFKSGISDLTDFKILLKAEWEKVYLFGQTKLLYNKKEKLHYLILEGEFYKGQQRTQLRVEANSKLGITIKVLIAEKEYEGLDFSFGGTSFYTNDKFKIGQQIDKLQLVVGSDRFLIPKSKIVKIFDPDNEGKKKVALIFIKMPPEMETNITKKVEAIIKELGEK